LTKKWSSIIKIVILLIVLLMVVGLRSLYQRDSVNLEKARLVLKEIKKICDSDGIYPNESQFREILKMKAVKDPEEWYLFTAENRQKGSFQYPMNLPILWAPGKAKISGSIPIIHAFIVVNPCEIKKVLQ
jgi:hypothetical protein